MARISQEEKKLNFTSKDMTVFKRMATDLAKDYDSKVDRDELAMKLFSTCNHWLNMGEKADLSDVVRSMVGIARPIMEETKIVDNSTKDDYENLKALLKGRRIALTDTQKEEVRNEKGTLQGFGLGYFTMANNGIPLDAIWSELVKESGYLLDPDANEGEMPIQLMEALEALKPKMGLAQYKENGMDENQMAIDVSDKSLNPAAVVVGHEIVHSIRENAPDLYEKLDNALVKWWKENDDITFDHVYNNRANRYKDQIKEWKDAGRTEKEIEDLVNEEIVAHATEALFEKWGSMNEEEQREFAEEIVKDDRSLAEKLLDFVRELLEKFRDALKGYKATSLEARTLSRNIELLTSFEDTFTDVLAEYGERNKAEGKAGEVVDQRGQESEGQQSKEVRHSRKEYDQFLREKSDEVKGFALEALKNNGNTGYKYNHIKVAPIPPDVVKMVKDATGGVLSLEGKELAFEGSKLRHEIMSHSDQRKENSFQQVAYTENDLNQFIEAVMDPDMIEDISPGDKLDMRHAVVFAKKIKNAAVVVAVSGGKHNPSVVPQEMLVFSEGKWDQFITSEKTLKEVIYANTKNRKTSPEEIKEIKKNRVTVVHHEPGSFAQTSETIPHSPLFDFNVPRQGEKNNENQKKNDENLKKRKSLKEIGEDSEGRKLTADQIEYFKGSKIVDDEGRLQKVYHGTEEDFTVFDRTKGRSTMDIQGSFFSPWEIDAEGYGQKVQAYYLNIKNPAPEGIAYKALNKFKGQNNAGIKAREYLEYLGYDGVNNGNEEYIAFYSQQIKLAANEHPTKNPDIRFSKKEIGADGIEEYTTSPEILAMTEQDRMSEINRLIHYEYTGKTVKFWRNGHAYYAIPNRDTWGKGFRGDSKSDIDGYEAKLKTAADGNYVELLEDAMYEHSSPDKKPAKGGVHTKNTHWDYYVKTVRIDGDLFDIVINVFDKGRGRDKHVYDVTVKRSQQNIALGNNGGIALASNQNIPRSMRKSNNYLPMFSKKEIDDINEIFEAEAERLHDLDFDKEMARISQEEKKLNFTSKDMTVFKRMATDLAKDYDSKVDRDELAMKLFSTCNHWLNMGEKADLSDIVRSMVGIARPIMEETKIVDNSTKEDYENLKSLLRGRRIALTDTQKEEIRNEKGTLQGFGLGYFTMANNGIPLDAIWSELVKESGYLLDPDANEGEMPIQLMEALEALKPKMGLTQYKENGMDENQMAIDIASALFPTNRKEILRRLLQSALRSWEKQRNRPKWMHRRS